MRNSSSKQAIAPFSPSRAPSILVEFVRALTNSVKPFVIQRSVSGFGEISWACTDIGWVAANRPQGTEECHPGLTAVHTKSSLGRVYLQSNLASDLVESVLGIANGYSRLGFSRLQFGVLETQLSSILEGVGIAPKDCSAALTNDKAGLYIRGCLLAHGCRGQLLIRIHEQALAAFFLNPDLPDEFGQLSLPIHLRLARTRIAQAEIDLLQVGDAILFDDTCFSSPSENWQALLSLPGFQLGGQFSANGDFSLTGAVGLKPLTEESEQHSNSATQAELNCSGSVSIEIFLETAAIPLTLTNLCGLLKGEVVSLGGAARNSLFLRERNGVPIPVEAVWVDGKFGAKISQPWFL